MAKSSCGDKRLEIARNAKTSNLVGAKLVGLGA